MELSSQPKTRRFGSLCQCAKLSYLPIIFSFFSQQSLKMIIEFREIDISRLGKQREGKKKGFKGQEFAFTFILVTDISPIARLMSVTNFK